MAVVWIPAQLREMAGGKEQVEVPGDTVWQLVGQLEARYPGLERRLCENGQLRAGLTVCVDGCFSSLGLRQRVAENSEVHFLPAISGG